MFKKSEGLYNFFSRELYSEFCDGLKSRTNGLSGGVVGKEVFVRGRVSAGESSVVGHRTIFSGEIELGANSVISPNAVVCGNLKIGKNVLIEAGAVILKNVPSNTYVAGNPAQFFHLSKKIVPRLFDFVSSSGGSRFLDKNFFVKHICDVGVGTSFGEQVFFEGGGKLYFEDGCRIGDRCVFATAHHELSEKKRILASSLKWFDVRVGKNARIGAGSIILGGVSIGKNAKILPGSVVVKDIKPNTVASGCPAQPDAGTNSHNFVKLPCVFNHYATDGQTAAPSFFFNKFKHLRIERPSIVNREVGFVGRKNVVVKKHSLISPRVLFVTETIGRAGDIVVEENAWIGTGAVLLPRVKISENAVVGAGAVVFSDVGEDEVWVGNPAKKIGRRKYETN